MKASPFLRTTLSLAIALVLLWSGQRSRAQIDPYMPQFAVGSTWIGFSQSTVNPSIRGLSTLLVQSQTGSQFTGQYLFNSVATPFVGNVTSDGSLVLKGTGRMAFQAMGAATNLGDGGFAIRFTYNMGTAGDTGIVQMLHRFAYDPSMHAFPPGPCKGQYTSADGVKGALQFERNDTTTDAARTTGFHGTLTFGDTAYNAVGTISPQMNRDGSYSFDLIAQPASVIPCIMPPDIHIVGRYFPKSTSGAPPTISGAFACIDRNTAGNPLQTGNFYLIALL